MYNVKDPRELVDYKTHQLWRYDQRFDKWYPIMDRQFSEDDYDRALRFASYHTQRGETVRLVTSVITFVL